MTILHDCNDWPIRFKKSLINFTNEGKKQLGYPPIHKMFEENIYRITHRLPWTSGQKATESYIRVHLSPYGQFPMRQKKIVSTNHNTFVFIQVPATWSPFSTNHTGRLATRLQDLSSSNWHELISLSLFPSKRPVLEANYSWLVYSKPTTNDEGRY